MIKTLKFEKYTGAGNSFLIADLRSKDNQRAFSKIGRNIRRYVEEICDSHFGIGADGVVFIQSAKMPQGTVGAKSPVKWDFYNADGSTAEMCGNAARCVGLFLYRHATKSRSGLFSVLTKSGFITTQVESVNRSLNVAIVEVEMPPIKAFHVDQKLGRGVNFDFVDSGVPHAVYPSRRLQHIFKMNPKDKMAATELFRDLSAVTEVTRELKQFRKKGTNVTFYEPIGKSAIRSLTFERGVPGFTLACGTGAVAAAVSYSLGAQALINVSVPGGQLRVDLRGARPKLSGPAQYLGTLELPAQL